MKKPTPKKQDPDYLFAFSCALNLGLYAADPGPQIVIVRNSDEQRTITRREHFVDLYSRMLLLLQLDGDPDRLSAVAAEAQRRLNETSARNPEPHDLKIRADTVEIAETAIRMVRDAGADVTFLGDSNLAGHPTT